MMEYSNRFPSWIFDYLPAEEYDIKPSRMLFGDQRFAICPVDSNFFKRKGHDFKSVEAATPWLNSINIYARIWKLYDDGRHLLIRELVKHINDETDEDLEGHSDRTILADLAHCKPEEVAQALAHWRFPNRKVLEDAKEAGWSKEDLESARIHGMCNVNGIVLLHVSRYRYAQMQFCMSETEKRKIKKHLKDCPVCSEIVEESMKAEVVRDD